MLIIQEITLVWHKEERGGKFAEMRSRFDFIFPIERSPESSDECLLDTRWLYQQGKRFYTPQEYGELIGDENFMKYRDKTPPPVKLSEVKVSNLKFSESEGKIQVDFAWGPRQWNGAPHRHGHNKDYNNAESPFFARNILNETAFTLEVGQKGRIAYNARFSDWDNGTWWYEQTIVNIANIRFEDFRSNILSSGKFDFVYEKLAELY